VPSADSVVVWVRVSGAMSVVRVVTVGFSRWYAFSDPTNSSSSAPVAHRPRACDRTFCTRARDWAGSEMSTWVAVSTILRPAVRAVWVTVRGSFRDSARALERSAREPSPRHAPAISGIMSHGVALEPFAYLLALYVTASSHTPSRSSRESALRPYFSASSERRFK